MQEEDWLQESSLLSMYSYTHTYTSQKFKAESCNLTLLKNVFYHMHDEQCEALIRSFPPLR